MSSNGDAFGSLAALFTSGNGGNGTTAQQAMPSRGGVVLDDVTVVLVGNLPVMAGLWTTQFADEVARASGPTALVRFERGDVTVELLRAEGRQVPPAGPGAVSRWLPRAASSVRKWLVCMPAETDPAEVLSSGQGIVLITGADEAAVTGGYLRLKHLADEGIARGAPVDRIGLVIVGAPPEQAAAAATRLAEAARGFLGIEVETVASMQRVERVESSARATYPAVECPAIAEFFPELSRARAEGSSRFDAPSAAPIPLSIPTPVEPKPIAEPAAVVAPRAVAPVAASPAPAHAVAPTAAPTAAPTPRAAPAFAALPVAQLPARLVPVLRGLRPLGISCPVSPDVELALDDERRMHIVGRSDQLAKVRTAHTWATMHRELLGLAFAELKDGFEVRERILLGDAREAITLHGTGVLLDVLVVADTPAGPVQVVVPLNDATTCG
jgi:hypothetical protein